MRALSTILIAAALLATAGCAKEKVPESPSSVCRDSRGDCGGTNPLPTATPSTGGGTDGAIPEAPTGTGENPSETGYDSGSTAALTLDGGTSKLSQLFFKSNPNNPQNVRINIDLSRQSDTVIVSYVDNGKVVEAAFGTVHPFSGVTNSMFNGWVNQDGQSVWKGFFQDDEGAVVLIVDKVLSQGDGSASFVGGSIWFQNFTRTYPNNPNQGPLKMCWEISRGPYDCRTFLVSNNVQMVSSKYPNNRGPDRQVSYQKLGEFNGILRAAAGF